MKLGLSVCSFTRSEGATRSLGEVLADAARRCEDAGIESLWVMDHFFQIPPMGAAELPMLDAYTTLGFCAAATSRIELGTLVTGVTYRHPGLLAKAVTTLDALSGGRAWLGIGAAWFDREHEGLGVPFPPLAERFERLEEALQVCLQMWGEDDGRYDGKYYTLAETLNSPQSVQRPHPPIMIGGSGEKKTLRLVAKYADACNIMALSPDFVRQKLDILESHCADVGRDPATVKRTLLEATLPTKAELAPGWVERALAYADLGVETVIPGYGGAIDRLPEVVDMLGEHVVPNL